jgi:DNA-binding NtrC family response regulator
MLGAGAILDISAGMNKTSCATIGTRHGNYGLASLPVRENSADEENFPVHVLVVDDEPLIRWSVTESLADAGLIVEQAVDAASALKIITGRRLPFDVVVLDLRLPDMHDLSLLGTIRQLMPAATVFVMTAFGTPTVVAQALELGARTVLTKPFELDDLKRLVLDCGRSS